MGLVAAFVAPARTDLRGCPIIPVPKICASGLGRIGVGVSLFGFYIEKKNPHGARLAMQDVGINQRKGKKKAHATQPRMHGLFDSIFARGTAIYIYDRCR